MDEVLFKLNLKFIFQNMNTNVQVKEKWKFTWCWVHSRKLKLLNLALRCWPTTSTSPTTWSRSRQKDMKLIIRRSSQVQYHVKSHQSSKKPFILNSYCSWFDHHHLFMIWIHIVHHPYCMLSSATVEVQDLLSIHLLLSHDFNITYFHKLFIHPNSITPHLICCKWS